jgi:hypothetical protein
MLITGQLSEGDFFPYFRQKRIIDAKDVFERAIRDPPVALKQQDDRWE